MKPKSKLLSLLLAICLVAGLMPTAAFAADGDKTIMLGTSGIKDPTAEGNTYYTPNSYIYYGKNGETPIKWRVLDADKANDNSTDGMFLLSEYLLENTQFHDSSNAWQGSTAQAWCETFASNTSNFSAAEQSAMLGIAKTDSTESNLYSLSWGESSLTADDKMFFLSVRELADYVGSYDGAPGLTATFVGGSAGVWWLRSPDASNTDFAGAVLTSGSVSDSIVNYDWAARPAFNLNLNSVLFTSAAVGGKSANGMDSGLTAVDDYAGSEWKLTLLDETREFAVTEQTVSGKPGDTITLNYTGATTGENEYISVIIADENGAQYYGRVAQPGGESGTATLSIPADLAPGSYTLNVFSEQYNGDYKTDYASAFAEVALTVEEAAAPGIDTGKAIQLVDSGTAANIGGGQADNIYFGTYQQSSDGSGGYNTNPVKWRVLSNASEQLLLLSDQNLDVFQYHTEEEDVTWETSTMRSWLNGYGAAQNTGSDNGIDYTDDNFIDTAFSDGEQGAIVDTTVVNDDNPDYNTEGGNDTTDQIFLFSIEEVQNADYGFTDDSSRIATNTAYVAGGGKIGSSYMNGVGEADYWWLRSPGDLDHRAAGVSVDGGVGRYGHSVRIAFNAVRPAFNLDLTSVLFTSAAAGGKSASGMDSGLTAIGDYDGNEWKLTLLDNSRNFVVTEEAASGKPGDTITLNYTGATTGENEYISVIIADENGAQYYGRVAQPGGESGTATLSIPADLAPGSYTLNVFSEQYNGDYKTDYASAFAEVALTVEEAAAPGIDTGKAIQLVDSGTAANIGGGQADNIYFGTYQQSSDGNSGYNIDPIKWRVLENANGQLFLLSDQNLDVFQYHVDYESVTWATSTMRSWLNGYGASHNTGDSGGIDYTDDNFINTAFSEKEQKAIAETEVVNDDNPTHGTEGGNNTTDQIFLLSIAEAQNSSYFADNSSRIATNTAYVAGGGKIGSSYMNGVGEADYWWLRSPGDLDHRAAGVSVDGGVGSYGFYVSFDSIAVRPAFNLDLTSVLFTSAAVGGKIPAASSDGNQGGEADAIFEIGDYDGSEWKLTLLDNSRNFVVTEEAASGKPGDTITLNYTGATTGTNEYISVIIADSSGAQYYGRVAQPTDTGGTVEITIPSGLADGTYTLYVFSEQYNGDYKTDYASAFDTVTLTVVDTIAPTLTADSASRDSETDATVTFTSDEAGSYYYAVVDSGAAEPTIDTTVAGTSCDTTEQTISLNNLTAGAKDIYIVVKDAAGNESVKLKIEIPAYTVVPKTYTLTVDLNGGSGSTIGGTYPAGEVVNINAGSRSNYRFDGWTSSNGGSFADASSASTRFTMPAANTTITAAWSYIGGGGSTTDYYRLTFDTNGGSEISSIRRAEYTTIDLTDYTPTREGYEFTGWYADEALTEKITSIRLTRNTTVYAGWEEIKENPSTGFENPFTDVSESDWFFNDVKFVYQNGLMNGTSATTFSPEGTTSRGMIVTILWRMAGSPDMEDKIWGYPFADVDATAYYGTAVYWARLNGIAGGYDDATFGPNDPITREQMAAILYRYAQYKGYDVSAKADLNKFTDADEISNYALEALQWANAEGLINGKGDGVLDPKGQATRAEAAAILTRFNEVVAE